MFTKKPTEQLVGFSFTKHSPAKPGQVFQPPLNQGDFCLTCVSCVSFYFCIAPCACHYHVGHDALYPLQLPFLSQ